MKDLNFYLRFKTSMSGKYCVLESDYKRLKEPTLKGTLVKSKSLWEGYCDLVTPKEGRYSTLGTLPLRFDFNLVENIDYYYWKYNDYIYTQHIPKYLIDDLQDFMYHYSTNTMFDKREIAEVLKF